MKQEKHTPTYSPEFRTRGVRLFNDHRADYASNNAAYKAIASKLGCSPDSLRAWCLQAERDAGKLAGPTSQEKARIKELEREVRELRQANEILKKASRVDLVTQTNGVLAVNFAQAVLDRPFRK